MDNQVQWDKEARVQRAKRFVYVRFQLFAVGRGGLCGPLWFHARTGSEDVGRIWRRHRADARDMWRSLWDVSVGRAGKGSNGSPDRESKKETYALVQQLAAAFKAHAGSIKCAEILKLRQGESLIPTPEARTPDYYAKRPCVKMVELAARMWADYYESVKKVTSKTPFL